MPFFSEQNFPSEEESHVSSDNCACCIGGKGKLRMFERKKEDILRLQIYLSGNASLEIVVDILIARNWWCSFWKWAIASGCKISSLNYLYYTNSWWHFISWRPSFLLSLFWELVFPSICWTKTSPLPGDTQNLAKQKRNMSLPFSPPNIFHTFIFDLGKWLHQLIQFHKIESMLFIHHYSLPAINLHRLPILCQAVAQYTMLGEGRWDLSFCSPRWWRECPIPSINYFFCRRHSWVSCWAYC